MFKKILPTLLLAAFLFPFNNFAQGIESSSISQETQTISSQNTVQITEPQAEIAEKTEVKETKNNFAASNNEVVVSGIQKGDHAYAGGKIMLESNLDHAGSLAIAGQNIEFKPGVKVGNNVYLAASDIAIDGANIQNAGFIFAENVTIKNSSFSSDTKIYATNITLENNTFNGKLDYGAENFINNNNNFVGGIFKDEGGESGGMSTEKAGALAKFIGFGLKTWLNDLWVLMGLIGLAYLLNKKKKLYNPRINFDANYVQDLMIGVSVLLGSIIGLGVLGFLSGFTLTLPLLAFTFLAFSLVFLVQPYTYIYIANLIKNSIWKNGKIWLVLLITAPIAWVLFRSGFIVWSLMILFFTLPAFGKLVRNLYFAIKEYILK